MLINSDILCNRVLGAGLYLSCLLEKAITVQIMWLKSSTFHLCVHPLPSMELACSFQLSPPTPITFLTRNNLDKISC